MIAITIMTIITSNYLNCFYLISIILLRELLDR